MASITMTASFLGTTVSKQPPTHHLRRGVVMAKAMPETTTTTKEETSSKRRDLVFAVAAAAACSVARIAMAEEPKRGTPEAKKKYAPVCVTMPSARICYK
ncbi:hypothetical protein SOVF_065540 [Spinacia oleracea]|uniref:Photosystem II 5 kDa protein, chloroplastic n=1 Tax=Spinacia oleracea TaxID=3562 RepID=A0A9R0J8H2_SPIOL|nr:photosystem II 5 kDa protein, chloroplastic [Spinacia oleracea]3JCU_U Chain U, Photosystem II Reaction Center Tn protein [Spinacia oleracea]3JCU_u Chain u, Photosystem II Reaction Center Tn protein [Spinacia oleracea]5XNM_U Chain U, Photosystem II luminal extrinsic protein Tn, PsbTn [Pisum sativum]5XNM_u Chain u, Photosystem II luminal extrinsic protein Tn, PsbTn [Pisum sativum]KNA18995.1 hypothetical protein SOVF_065540 [Spinacia oleracea]